MREYLSMLKRKLQQIFIRDRIYWQYLFNKRKFRALFNYLWSRLYVRDIAGGIVDPLFRRFPLLAPYPSELEIEVTTLCHLKCIFCEHSFWKDQPQKNLSFNDFKIIIDQFPNLKFINLTGEGTCFLNPDFFKMIRYLKRSDVFVMFVDSFDIFDAEKSKQVIELGVERIEVSLDAACKETYEKIKTGAKWNRTLTNLRTLRDLKKQYESPFPFIFFRYVVNTLNMDEIYDFVELVADLDMNLGQWTVVEFCGLLSFEKNEHLFVEALDLKLVQTADRRAAEKNIQVAWSHINRLPAMEICSKWQQPYIMIGGDVVIDCAVLMSDQRRHLRTHRICNLIEEPFKLVWNSEYYRNIRKSVPRKQGPVSKHCLLCRGYDIQKRAQKYGIFDELSVCSTLMTN